MEDANRAFFYVGDSKSFCEELKSILSKEKFQCYMFTCSETAFDELTKNLCHILMIDADVKDFDAIEYLREVKMNFPTLQVFIVSGKGDISLAVNALKAGANNFIERPFNADRFIPILTEALDIVRNADSYYSKTLTVAERKVLAFVMQGHSNKEIAAIQHRSVRTIEDHRNRVMKKLGAHNAVELAKIALKLGY
ncbi:MAG: response regulator [Phycisphaerae bacterium]|nr:response regulator [Phycisphaerae bacterium]